MKAKNSLKRFVKKTLLRSRVIKGAGCLTQNRIAILCYHSVQPEGHSLRTLLGDGIVHSQEDFAAQMRLAATQCTPITLDDVLACCRGEAPVPKRGVVITFDDGFRDNYEIAAPILASVGIPAAFYVTVGSIEANSPPWFCRLRHSFCSTKRLTWTNPLSGSVWHLSGDETRREAFRDASRHFARLAAAEKEELLPALERDLDVPRHPCQDQMMMSWAEIASLRRAGHIIGSHTMSHPNVAQVPIEVARDELARSKHILEDRLAAPCVHFSYPHPILQPHWSEPTVSLCQELGYQTAATCNSGSAKRNERALVLPRVGVPRGIDAFRWKIEMAFLGRRP